MKVAHRDDYDTHAVIGGNNVMEFGIAQTAEFFTVLSNTLYTNKPLAVTREVLCNAWDAHIVAGRRVVPVEVTVDREKLVIRDFGHGIHPKNMHTIYCVYGASTKENDGNQTGGFGLGSKAPFAYSDHFTVTTHHEGMKTVYAISRGSKATEGKPDIRVMVQVPTKESGLEVMIPLKSSSDAELFSNLIKTIARFGDMNVNVNGKPVPKANISDAENNIYLTKEEFTSAYGKVFVRYGNVVYPIPVAPEYITPLMKVQELVTGLKSGDYNKNNYRLILQAPPNSISVSPSRESLSLTDTTIETIFGLLNNILPHLDYNNLLEMQETHDAIFGDMFEWYKQKNLLMRLHDAEDPFKLYASRVLSHLTYPETLLNTRAILVHRIRTRDKTTDEEYYRSMVRSAHFLSQNQKKTDPRGHLLKLFLKLEETPGWGIHRICREVHSRAFQPLMGRLLNVGLVPKNLCVYVPSHGRWDEGGLTPVLKYIPSMTALLPMLRPQVILTYNKSAFIDEYTESDRKFALVYIVPRTKTGHSDAVAFFERMGFTVNDFATQWDKDRIANQAYALPAASRTVYEGLASLVNLTAHRHGFKPNGHRQDNPDRVIRITDYTHVIQAHNLSGSDWDKKFFPWGDEYGKKFVDRFKDQIGICTNVKQLKTQMEKKGKGDGVSFIIQSISQEILTNPRIRTYFGMQGTDSSMNTDLVALLRMGEHSPLLRKEFDLPEPVTAYDLETIKLYEHLVTKAKYPTHKWEKEITLTHKEVEQIKLKDPFQDLRERVQRSLTFGLLNIQEMADTLGAARTDQRHGVTSFIEMSVLNALK